ncbi:MAG: hypothetical protein JXA67_07545 [Micromonosporaceae bacterium]|nr:hypothetical protein [Micromonosporaceae bacterium]
MTNRGEAAGSATGVRGTLTGMSGKSRRRSSRAGTTSTQRSARGASRQRLRLPGLREVYDAVLAACAELSSTADALDAELWLAANVCAMRASAPDSTAFQLAMLDLVDEAERDGRDQCLLLLRVMAAVGPHGLREPVTRAAERLIHRVRRGDDGLALLPGWVERLGQVTPAGDCCVWTDVFGEFAQVYCEYLHADGGRRHGLLFTIDLAFHGTIHSVDVVVVPKYLDRMVPDLQRAVRRDGGRLERVPPAEAAGLLRAALVAAADPGLPHLRTAGPDDALHTILPLAVARVTAMPGGDEPAPSRGQVTAAWPPSRRQGLVEEFLAAHPDGWTDADIARRLVARIVDASVDTLGFPPDRIGPNSVGRLLGEVVPSTIAIPQSLLAQAQQVARTWVRWRTDALDLPRAARREMRRAALSALAAFPDLCDDRRLNPTVPYLADTPAAGTDGPAMAEVLRRRSFAVPLPGQRGDGMIELPEPANGLPAGQTHVDDLDAADPAHRQLITAIGQTAHGTATRRIDAAIAVVEQLWDDRPAAVWQAAQRLSATGLPRHQVLDRLAGAWQRHGPNSPGGGPLPDPTAGCTDTYTAALHTLGTAPATRH